MGQRISGVVILLDLVLLLGFGTAAFARTMIAGADVWDLEDLVIKSSDGHFKLNNFTLREEQSLLGEGLTNLHLNFSARNRSSAPVHFSVILVGTGKETEKSNQTVVWAASVEPLMSTLVGERTEMLSHAIYCDPGTVARTEKVIVKVIGDFQ